MQTHWLTTDRLALRRCEPADLDWLVALRSDPDVMRFVGGPQSREATKEVFETRILGYYDEHPGLGIWLTVERATGRAVGFHVLSHIPGEHSIQVGFILQPEAWGQGFGTEMARALMQHGFVTLALPQIVAIAALDNDRSHHVLQKIGLRRNGVRSFRYPAYAAAGPLAWFERDRHSWLEERGVAGKG